MANRNMFVGMDVHEETIAISVAEEGRHGEVRRYGVIPGDLEALAKVVRALRARDRVLHFVYEAGPCGFGIHRYLTTQGEACVGVNPSSMPKRSGDRIKTDRRDGDALVLNGEKTWITNGTMADVAIVWARAEDGIRGFLIERGTPGFEVGKHLDLIGLRGTGMAPLYFNDCRVPAENVIVPAGQMRPRLLQVSL